MGEAWLELKTYVFNQQHLTTRLLHNYCFNLNLNLTTRVPGHKLLLACRTLGSLSRLGHARWSRSLTGPHAGLARFLGREHWSTKIPKRSKKQRPKGSNPHRWV
jgi:hypothetical protein